MKKYLTPCLAILAVIAIIFCFVFNGDKGNLQKQLDEAKTAAETQAADLQKQLDEAKAATETQVTEAVEAAKAELQEKLTAAEEAKTAAEEAKTAAEAKVAELEKQIADAAAAAPSESALTEAVDAAKAELQEKLTAAEEAKAAAEAKVAELEKQIADAAGAGTSVNEAVDAAKAEVQEKLTAAEAKAADLQKQLDDAKAAAETQLTEAVEAAKAEMQEKLTAAEEAKAAAEAKVADLQKQLENASTEVKETVEEATEQTEEAVTEAVEQAEEAAAEKTEQTEEAAPAETTEAAPAETEAPAETTEAAPAETEAPAETAEAAPAETEAPAETAEAAPAETAGEVKVMSHEEYMAAENDTEVVIESYVQAHQDWFDNKVTVYLQSEDGAYFAYEMVCSEEDAAKLVPGQKIRVTGYKTEWSGEVEIASGCTFEFVDGDPYIAEAEDVTALLASEDLIKHMNEFVSVKGATIVAQESGEAFSYKNPEEKTDDLYFAVEVDGKTYNFCVEFHLCGKDTDVYKAVEGLKVGDVVDLEGFLYWYNGANLQVTGLTVK